MGRCQPEPISLFDKPMPDDEKAAVQYVFPEWLCAARLGDLPEVRRNRLLGRIRFCSSLAAVPSNHR